MTEQNVEPGSSEQAAGSAGEAQQDSTDWKAEARKWEQRAKDNRARTVELERAQRVSMTEQERALADARQQERAAVVAELGRDLAREQFLAAAARRNPEADGAKALGYLDLSRLLSEDGRPDPKAVEAAAADLIPEASGRPRGDVGQGARATAPTNDMNSIIRRAAGLA